MALLSKKENNDGEDSITDFHFPTSKKAIIIFTRNPELGKCKTRLAATVGDEKALEIYKFLIAHTVEITTYLKADKFVYYSEKVHHNDFWDSETFRKKVQEGDDLGVRMHNAFSEVFSLGYEKAIIIGSDMYDMVTQDIENAFEGLSDKDFVIGPAEDGGYYLLGMKEVKSAVFKNKIWGTDTVLKDTLADLKDEKVLSLTEKNDVDYYEDIKDVEAFQPFLKDLKTDK